MPPYADVAQLVERQLPKLEVAGSKPVVRSSLARRLSSRSRGWESDTMQPNSGYFAPEELDCTILVVGFSHLT
jgi:hypothetical protein